MDPCRNRHPCVVAGSAGWQERSCEAFQTRSIKSAGRDQGTAREARLQWSRRVRNALLVCAHSADGPRYRIQSAERSVGASSRGDGPSSPRGGAARLGQVSPRADTHAACPGSGGRRSFGIGRPARIDRPGLSGHRMALLTTFPKLGASPGVGLSGALPWGRTRSIADGSLRPISAASGGLQSLWAGTPGAICQAAVSAARRAQLENRPHTRPRT